MSNDLIDSPFLQLKIDYISFMTQIYSVMSYEENITSIIYSLLIENQYLTQEELEILTGIVRSTISETLSKLTNITSKFPVLQTRKPKDKKKYYHIPLDFEDYIKDFFTLGQEKTGIGMDFLPNYIYRLNNLDSKDKTVVHLKDVFILLFVASELYNKVMYASSSELDKMFLDENYKPKISSYLDGIDDTIDIESLKSKIIENKRDSILKVKKDFINEMLALSTSLVGGKNDQISVFMALFLSPKPVTQAEIEELTGVNRARISQSLKDIVDLGVIKEEKKSGKTKQYFANIDLMQYSFGKLGRLTRNISQILIMMKRKFIPDLEKIETNNGDERERLRTFFENNLRCYKALLEYSKEMHSVLLVELKQKLSL